MLDPLPAGTGLWIFGLHQCWHSMHCRCVFEIKQITANYLKGQKVRSLLELTKSYCNKIAPFYYVFKICITFPNYLFYLFLLLLYLYSLKHHSRESKNHRSCSCCIIRSLIIVHVSKLVIYKYGWMGQGRDG